MKKIKSWMKNLDDKRITSSLKEYMSNSEYSDVSDETKQKMQERFRNTINASSQEENIGFFNRLPLVPFLAAAAAILIAVGFIIKSPVKAAGTKDIIMTATVSGNVQRIHTAGSTDIDSDYVLSVGDSINTGPDSVCSIEFDANTLVLTESSTITLKSANVSSVEMQLEKGRVDMALHNMQENQKFSVITNTSKITALGTEFSVELTDANETDIYLAEGTLEVILFTNGNRTVILEQNSEMIISGNGYQIESPPAKPREILKD